MRDPNLVLELAARAVPALHWNNNRPQLAGILNVVAWATAGGRPDAAAELQGAARRLALAGVADSDPTVGGPGAGSTERPGTMPGLVIDLRREATHHLAATLGDERLRELRAQGEAMGTDEVVHRTLSLIEDVLGQPGSAISRPTDREAANPRT
jgi:hypothetical protein